MKSDIFTRSEQPARHLLPLSPTRSTATQRAEPFSRRLILLLLFFSSHFLHLHHRRGRSHVAASRGHVDCVAFHPCATFHVLSAVTCRAALAVSPIPDNFAPTVNLLQQWDTHKGSCSKTRKREKTETTQHRLKPKYEPVMKKIIFSFHK